MLFPKRNPARENVRYVKKNVQYVVFNQNVPKNLSVLCHNAEKHILPVAMRYRGIGLTNSGVPTAEYVCDLCKKRQGWVYDTATGRPKLLWFRNGK